MTDATDMSTPVTRSELREELQELRQEFRQELQQALMPLATKQELANLATKQELANLATKQELANLATKSDLEASQEAVLTRCRADLEIWGGALLDRFDRMEQRLQADLARHAKAFYELMSTHMSTIDEKYADLPGRVNRLETVVFSPEQR